jgi:chemotaxis protein methyltransferase CheR
MTSTTTLSPDEFGYVRNLVHDLSGNVLEHGKGYLVEARLQPVARRLGFDSVRRLLTDLRAAAPNQRHFDAVEAMTTKETMFFRDAHLFDALRDEVLPRLNQGGRSVSVWCIGCSTGQEPYSLAMLADRCRPPVAGADSQRYLERSVTGGRDGLLLGL